MQLQATRSSRLDQQARGADGRRLDQQAVKPPVRQQAEVLLRRRAIRGDERHQPIGVRGQSRDTAGDAMPEHGSVEERNTAAARLGSFPELGPALHYEQRMSIADGTTNGRDESGVRREQVQRRAARREQFADGRRRHRRFELPSVPEHRASVGCARTR